MKRVLVMDSGIGGVSVLRQIRRFSPKTDCVYFADNEAFPYGSMSQTRLCERAVANVADLLKRHEGISIVALACNTLTAVAIDTLRSQFHSLTFVGTEPSVKQALEYTTGNVLVACTSLSAHSDRLRRRFSQENVKFLAFPELACLIEEGRPQKEICAYIDKTLSECSFSFDCVVLGCTHFSLCRDLFERVCVRQVFDGAKGVATRVRGLIREKGRGTLELALSRCDEKKTEQLKKLLGIQLA